MVTTFAADDDLAKRFRGAVRSAYPDSFGQIKREFKQALENHIKLLKEKNK